MVENDDKEKINSFSYLSMMIIMIISSFFGLTSFLMFNNVKQNAFISGILGMIFGFVILIIFMILKKNMGDRDIIDYNIYLFGKIFGNIINIILNVSIFLVATFFLQNINNFISTNYLTETSFIYIKVLILSVVAFAASKKISIISKVTVVIMIIYIFFYVTGLLGIFTKTDFSRIFPICNFDYKMLKYSSIYSVCGLFSVFLLTIIPQSKLYKDEKLNKKIVVSYIIANLVEISIILLSISLLGEDLLKVYKFNEYIALHEFSLFSIIERVENTMGLQFVINIFITMTVMVYFIYTSIGKIIKNNNFKGKFSKYGAIVTASICFLMLIFSEKVYTSITVFSTYIEKYYMLLILIGIIIPMSITCLCGIINKKLIKST